MIWARRVEVGDEPIDLAAGTGTSGVSIQMVRNRETSVLYVGDPNGVDPVQIGLLANGPEDLPPVTLAPQDHLWIWRSEGEAGPVDVITSWS